MVEVKHITSPVEKQKAYAIREKVFVHEQHVPAEEEYDEFEEVSRHFLAYMDGIPCGTARWRYTENGIKLERFAVSKEYRNQKIGSALVQAILNDINNHPLSAGKTLYLHGQISAKPLYSKFGFTQIGDMFEECNIQHYKMVLIPDKI